MFNGLTLAHSTWPVHLGCKKWFNFCSNLEWMSATLYRTDNSGLSYWSSLITIISSGSLLSDETLKQTSRDIMDLLSQVGWSENESILSMLIEKGSGCQPQGSFRVICTPYSLQRRTHQTSPIPTENKKSCCQSTRQGRHLQLDGS